MADDVVECRCAQDAAPFGEVAMLGALGEAVGGPTAADVVMEQLVVHSVCWLR